MRITIVSPHRDDAAFSVGLAIQTWLAAGHRVEVINCFTESEYGPFGDQTLVDADERRLRVTARRHEEDVRWIKCYDRRIDLIDLGLMDAPERMPCSVEDVCRRAVNPDDAAGTMIGEALTSRAIDALVLPLGIGLHVDHLTARIAAHTGRLPSFPVAIYEDLPYAARPGAVAGIDAWVRNVDAELHASFVGRETHVTAAKESKLRMALCYDSQIDGEVVEQIAAFCERYGGRERLWANRAWLDAGLGICE